MSLGRWPLVSVEEARSRAADILRGCRSGVAPVVREVRSAPTLEVAIDAYATAKGIKPLSLKRYQSILRTHFADWWPQPVTALATQAFAQRCHEFAQTKGAALVEVGRGLIGALLKYLNAVHRLNLTNPFHRLADAGLLPERAKPRARKLQEADLPTWRAAVDTLPPSRRDYLMLLVLAGLRRNEGTGIMPEHVDWDRMVITIPETKNGYGRVSTGQQTTNNQRLELVQAGYEIDTEFWFADEGISGKVCADQRPAFKRLLGQIRKGETLVVSKLDRLGRDAIDVLQTVRQLAERGIKVIVLQLGTTDLTSPAGKLLLSMLAAVAEMERDLLVERTQTGLARVRAEGKKLGRPSKTTPEQRSEILRRLGEGESVSALARAYSVSRANIISVRSSLGKMIV